MWHGTYYPVLYRTGGGPNSWTDCIYMNTYIRVHSTCVNTCTIDSMVRLPYCTAGPSSINAEPNQRFWIRLTGASAAAGHSTRQSCLRLVISAPEMTVAMMSWCVLCVFVVGALAEDASKPHTHQGVFRQHTPGPPRNAGLSLIRGATLNRLVDGERTLGHLGQRGPARA